MHAVRAVIQQLEVLFAILSHELGINMNTLAKWHNRAMVEDLNTGGKGPSCNNPDRRLRGDGRRFLLAHVAAAR